MLCSYKIVDNLSHQSRLTFCFVMRTVRGVVVFDVASTFDLLLEGRYLMFDTRIANRVDIMSYLIRKLNVSKM